MADLEKSKEKSSWGGARPGAGRPEGSMNPETKERMRVKAAYIERVNKHADDLFNAQYALAVGEHYLMVKKSSGAGKDRKTWVEVVSDPETIKDYLDDDGATLNKESDDEYYYMTTKPANGLAIDSMLNRAIGKPEDKVLMGNDPENPLPSSPVVADPTLAAEFAEFMRNKK
ncbi:MAG TPA: hypothetical protein VFT87_05560 [Candidatus Saccharimonadales bacterium]|nr:hypothetical protein [Candidatus Saccharimonadales bacterium]